MLVEAAPNSTLPSSKWTDATTLDDDVSEANSTSCANGNYSADACWPTWVLVGVPLTCVVFFVLTLIIVFFRPSSSRGGSESSKTVSIDMRPLNPSRQQRRRQDQRTAAASSAADGGSDAAAGGYGYRADNNGCRTSSA